MKIVKRKRLLYFYDYTEDELRYLEGILTKVSGYNKDKIINMLFKDGEECYTYFGYLDYILNKFKTPIQVKDESYKDINTVFRVYDVDKIKHLPNITLRDYQVKAVEKCLDKRFGTVVASVGSGKTAMMASLANYIDKPTLIVCPDSQLVYQNGEKFIQYGIDGEKIGYLTGRDKKLNYITIGTFATIKSYIEKYPKDMEKFKVLIFEESHTSQQSETGRYIDKFYLDIAEYVLGFTGSLYRYDNINKSIEDFIMLGLTGKPIVNIGINFLIKRGYLTEPIIYIEPIKSFIHPSIKSWNNVYKRGILNSKDRNAKIIEFIELFDKVGLTSLTLIKEKIHGKELLANLPDDVRDKTLFVCGNGEIYRYKYGTFERLFIDYNELMEEFKKPDSEYKHLIATQVFSTGTDMPTLNAVILGYTGKSYVQVIQRLGRVLRLHPSKSKVFIIDFFDDSHKYLRNQSYERINIYKKEGFKIVNKDEFRKSLIAQGMKRKMWIKEELSKQEV